jgi:hypothetical protein
MKAGISGLFHVEHIAYRSAGRSVGSSVQLVYLDRTQWIEAGVWRSCGSPGPIASGGLVTAAWRRSTWNVRGRPRTASRRPLGGFGTVASRRASCGGEIRTLGERTGPGPGPGVAWRGVADWSKRLGLAIRDDLWRRPLMARVARAGDRPAQPRGTRWLTSEIRPVPGRPSITGTLGPSPPWSSGECVWTRRSPRRPVPRGT